MEEHKTYSIGTVAKMVGVPKYKLRHWCDRYLPEIEKIDNRKGSPATFILHYVFNELRNIERSCSRGTFDKAHKNCDVMAEVAFRFEDLGSDGNWIPEVIDYENPEDFLIARQTLERLGDLLGEREMPLLLGQTSMEQYSESIIGPLFAYRNRKARDSDSGSSRQMISKTKSLRNG